MVNCLFILKFHYFTFPLKRDASSVCLNDASHLSNGGTNPNLLLVVNIDHKWAIFERPVSKTLVLLFVNRKLNLESIGYNVGQ